MSDTLAERAARRFSSLYLTLVSVLVGLVLSDLFSAIHDRMTLWPLTFETGRTWCQIFGNTLAVLSAWITYSHLGLLRNRLPTIWDTIDVMLVLVTVPLNAATGRHDGAAWFFWAAGYTLLGLTAIRINLWQASHEPALAHLKRLGRFGGPYTVVYLGTPAYLALALASARHWTTPVIELLGAATAPIAAVLATILFMRDWREAVLHPPAAP
ncbi:MAG: hypothetical protein WAU68_15525 [Vitreimonas sp.]